jgi:hypothetical protein
MSSGVGRQPLSTKINVKNAARVWDIKTRMREIYSETVVEHNLNPRNLGSFPDADGYA